MPLAQRMARRYRNRGESLDDLEQVAYLGLIKAMDRYDPSRGSFARYAVPSVLGALKRHFRDHGWGVHVPRALQERALEVNAAIEHLSAESGLSPTAKDIARHTGHGLEEVTEALEALEAYTPAALDAPRRQGFDDQTIGDGIGAEDAGYELVELTQSVAPALRALPERDQAVLQLRFRDDLTQTEIAGRIGVSQMQVSRLLSRSLDRLNIMVEEPSEC